MSILAAVRTFNRSQGVTLGDKTLSTTKTVWANLDNKRVQRDIARHSTLGAVFPYGDSFFQNDDGVVDLGGKVTTRPTTLVVDVSAVNFTRGDGTTKGAGAAGTATLGAADATNPRVDAVVVDTTSGAFSVAAGVATAGANTTNLLGKPTAAANRIVLAYVVILPTATTLVQTNVVDVRP